MKNALFVFGIVVMVLAAGCCSSGNVSSVPERDTVIVTKNVPVIDMETIDSLLVIIEHNNTVIISRDFEIDSLKQRVDTLAKKLLYEKAVVSQVEYYLDICMRNPSQDKFLKGWIRRALSK